MGSKTPGGDAGRRRFVGTIVDRYPGRRMMHGSLGWPLGVLEVSNDEVRFLFRGSLFFRERLIRSVPLASIQWVDRIAEVPGVATTYSFRTEALEADRMSFGAHGTKTVASVESWLQSAGLQVRDDDVVSRIRRRGWLQRVVPSLLRTPRGRR
jgi:hypothetical protein